jgi:hypothetical protein
MNTLTWTIGLDDAVIDDGAIEFWSLLDDGRVRGSVGKIDRDGVFSYRAYGGESGHAFLLESSDRKSARQAVETAAGLSAHERLDLAARKEFP